MFKKIILAILAIVIVLIAFVVIKTLTFTADEIVETQVEGIQLPDGAIERFQKSITFPTVSFLEPEKLDTSAFLGFNEFMKEAYPLVDSVMERKFFLVIQISTNGKEQIHPYQLWL